MSNLKQSSLHKSEGTNAYPSLLTVFRDIMVSIFLQDNGNIPDETFFDSKPSSKAITVTKITKILTHPILKAVLLKVPLAQYWLQKSVKKPCNASCTTKKPQELPLSRNKEPSLANFEILNFSRSHLLNFQCRLAPTHNCWYIYL